MRVVSQNGPLKINTRDSRLETRDSRLETRDSRLAPRDSRLEPTPMPKRSEPPLSRRERQIMDVIYSRGQASASEVTAALPDGPGKTAVRTLMRILEEK